MRKGIIIEHTLVDTFDGADIHKKEVLEPNTSVTILDHCIVYGIDYVKIEYGNGKIGFIDDKCIVETTPCSEKNLWTMKN